MRNVKFQSPDVSHTMQIWRLVDESERLDNNSRYIYALWCNYFAEHSAVALDGDEVLAFVNGFRCPNAPDVYFLWQTAAKPRHGIPNLGVDLIQFAAEREIANGARAIEASMNPKNTPIKMLMKTLCRRLGGEVKTGVLFPGETLSTEDFEHYDEFHFRIELPDPRPDAASK